ncbi:MAG: response regulator transcription factor [Acidimicrobiia bacterium]
MLGLLSQREIEVITLVARGRVDKQIARELDIEIPTVRSYIERVGRKTGRTRRADLTALAYELGLMR